MKTYTNWTEATTDPIKAIAGLLSAQNAGRNAWIEVQKNGQQDYPIKIKNPALNNPFNWTMSYGVPTEPTGNEKYFNDTEKDLTLNWTACFGEREAIEIYQNESKITEGISKGVGICNPVKKEDLLTIRPDLKGVDLWTTHWKPKDKIPYWVTDESINDVFVVCTNDEPMNKNSSLESAIAILQQMLK